MFTPIHTERLVIRPMTLDDVANIHARRNNPDAARYQDWEVPYSLDRARSLVAHVVELGGPVTDEWWMAQVCLHDGTVVGDLAVNLTWEGRSAEVGYTFEPASWGRGFATEALSALVDYLFDDVGVTRVWGALDPANPPSARLLERTGFLYEGRTRLSFWKDGEPSDDLIYGMVREDRDAWAGRPTSPPENVEFIEVDTENFERVADLKTHESQKAFVAPMLWSFSDALFPEVVDGAPVVPWMRAVMADDDLVGFVMMALATDHHPDPYLWRLLVDRMHQRKGIGTRIMAMVVDQCREWGASALVTSWEEGPGSPRPFYLGLGFEPTGRIIDEETEGRLAL